ncbi:MAG: hypothetical protein A2X17_09005 [Bacteroidetes bacterium GWF2_41_61]|nr:MAG: hypothetical protein A2X17_09005 [Bacteroidetes bacterium GWF2_41_61]OFY91500.1 MAG: hypothetical protein A2266_05855 [Bacteroidetes bacterium RIFOXYA12_FULL_40_10]HBG23895.1 hypothetical protein [Rikenellaceae bacterium]
MFFKNGKIIKYQIITAIVFILISGQVFAQNDSAKAGKGKIGLTFSSFGDIVVYEPEPLEGAGGREGDYFYVVGLTYLKPLKGRLELETGIEFTRYGIIQTPALYPPFDMTPSKKSISMISVPVGVRLNFLKYLFINGALLFDLETSSSSSVNSQTGIGAMGGVAVKYDFHFGGSIFINPYIKTHSLISFGMDNHKQMLFESGIRVGFSF